MYDFNLTPLEVRHQQLPNAEDLEKPPAYSEKAVQVIKTFNEKRSRFIDKDARRETCIEMALPMETVNEYLVFSDFFEKFTLKRLAEEKLNIRQYSDVLKIVQRATLKLYQGGRTDEEIRSWVTKLVEGILSEFKEYGKISRKTWLLEWDGLIGYGKKVSKASEKPFCAPKKKSFLYPPGVTRALYGPKTAEDIQGKLDQVIGELSGLPKVDADSVDSLRKGLIEAIGALGSIGIALKDIEKEDYQEADLCLI